MRKSPATRALINSIKAKAAAQKYDYYVWANQNQEYIKEQQAKRATEQAEKLEKFATMVYNHYLKLSGSKVAQIQKDKYIQQNSKNPF